MKYLFFVAVIITGCTIGPHDDKVFAKLKPPIFVVAKSSNDTIILCDVNGRLVVLGSTGSTYTSEALCESLKVGEYILTNYNTNGLK